MELIEREDAGDVIFTAQGLHLSSTEKNMLLAQYL
jgi:hypothetical protein